MSEERHLGRHVVAFDRSFHLLNHRHHRNHHQANDGQHTAKQQDGGDRSGDARFVPTKRSSQRPTSTRWTSTSKKSGRFCDETLNPSAPLARS